MATKQEREQIERDRDDRVERDRVEREEREAETAYQREVKAGGARSADRAPVLTPIERALAGLESLVNDSQLGTDQRRQFGEAVAALRLLVCEPGSQDERDRREALERNLHGQAERDAARRDAEQAERDEKNEKAIAARQADVRRAKEAADAALAPAPAVPVVPAAGSTLGRGHG